MATAPLQSIITSQIDDVRFGRKDWWISSLAAITAVLARASPASFKNPDFGSVSHHARSHVSATNP